MHVGRLATGYDSNTAKGHNEKVHENSHTDKRFAKTTSVDTSCLRVAPRSEVPFNFCGDEVTLPKRCDCRPMPPRSDLRSIPKHGAADHYRGERTSRWLQ